jgi:hypothetical protein
MGISFKIAPGVRVRASSRGLRTSVGPRIARVHVGGGRSGISTGVGPFTAYSAFGGSAGRRPGSPASAQRALAEAAKYEQAQQLHAALHTIMNLHRRPFPPMPPPVAPELPAINTRPVLAAHRASAFEIGGLASLAAWRHARQRAVLSARQEIAQLERERGLLRAANQRDMDRWWHRLGTNDPAVLLPALNAAFSDNEAPALAVGVTGADVALVVIVPGLELIPDRQPGQTPTGSLTLRTLSKSERGALHLTAVVSHVLLTVREALAVGRGITTTRIVAVRRLGPDAYGRSRLEPVLAARFTRESLDGIAWSHAGALDILRDAGSEQVSNIGVAANEIRPIDLSSHPAYAGLLAKVSPEQLRAHA